MPLSVEDQKLFGLFFEELEGRVKTKELSPKTLKNYGNAKKVMDENLDTKKGVLNMEKKDFKNLIRKLKQKYAPSSIYIWIRFLSAFYSFLAEEEILEFNLITRYEVSKMLPKIDYDAMEMKKDFLEPWEFEAYLKACYRTKNYLRNQALCWIYISPGGPRSNEALHIQVENIDLQRKRILLVDTKGGKPRYIIPYPRGWEKIMEYVEVEGLVEGDLLDLSYGGLYYLITDLGSKIQKEDFDTAEQWGTFKKKNIHPHRFRASACIWLRRDKVSSRTIQKLFGWSSEKMIKRYDTVVQQDVDDEITELFNNARENGTTSSATPS